MTASYDAFLLTSFGGPEKPDDVMSFLENVTRGRGIPRERLEAVAHHYIALGGVSPINGQNRALMAALRGEFELRGIRLPIYLGNRNWDPFLASTLRQIDADGHRRLIAFATSAYSSYSGCRQYREDLAAALAETGLDGKLTIDKIRPYFDHPGFTTPFADGLVAALAELSTNGVQPAATLVLFTTHSIPRSMAAASGPPARFDQNGAYVAQHRAAIHAVVGEAARRGTLVPRHSLVYQSRSGAAHIPWLEPDINQALRDAAAERVTAVVVVPIGFVSDHVEVVWDLDREAQATAQQLGMRMIRVATPGTHPMFLAAIAELVEERLYGRAPAALSALGPWPAVCAAGCCLNARGALPTVAGVDSTVGLVARP